MNLPPLSNDEFSALKADITAHGVSVPIIVDETGRILDGRHRHEIDPNAPRRMISGLTEAQKDAYTFRANFARRNLSPDQKAEVLQHMREIADRLIDHDGMTQAEAAVELGVPEGTVAYWRTSILGAKNVNDRVDHRVRILPEDRQKIVEEAETRPQAQVAADYGITQSRVSQIVKRENVEARRAAQREQDAQRVLDTKAIEPGMFPTIMADPPWDWGDEGDHDQLGRAKPTYATMPFDDLLDLHVPTINGDASVVELTTENAHLYVWITNRSLPKGFRLIEAWGFRYITTITWCKPLFGMGNYFRGATEHLLFGVRGSLPLKVKDQKTWFQAKRGMGGHSSKPGAAREIIERCSHGPYLELFAREPHPGWIVWGPEVQEAAA